MITKRSDEIEAVLAKFDEWGSLGASIYVTKEEVGYCRDLSEVKHLINEKILDVIDTLYFQLGIK